MANKLTTLTKLKDFLNISYSDNTKDQRLLQIINAASVMIENFFGFSLLQASAAEKYDGNDRQYLLLKRFPLVSITTLTINDIADTAYEIDNYAKGILFRLNCWPSAAYVAPGIGTDPHPWAVSHNIDITYTAGWILPGTSGRDLPEDIEEACLQLCEYLHNHAPRINGISAEKIGGYSVNYEKRPDAGDDIPPAVKRTLRRYKRTVV